MSANYFLGRPEVKRLEMRDAADAGYSAKIAKDARTGSLGWAKANWTSRRDRVKIILHGFFA